MLKLKQRLKDEKGSATLEFLGMVPYVFLMMLVLWQFLVCAFAAITVQSAANEAAKVFSTTSSELKAKEASGKIVNNLKNVAWQYHTIAPNSDGRHFEAKVQIQLKLAFLPSELLGMTIPTVPINYAVVGRKI
ncbi:hypothetical protein BEP19_08860 [Ammoniphilus oxalaticus]|uniref:TadE-like domain-containing protein n=1 Tax=Ammoniphilus oxalaticus TaxID=66863 RepID=A0A419SKH5_9BACL|nr:TadE family protein [Ammoniphilus oxalaticus]RKD24485.1 hypothetical protein BEP19_08860 [Ammoniphilus oxalaticus]